MTMVPYDFPESPHGPRAVRLTDVNGVELTRVSDNVSFYKLVATGAQTLKFYSDHNGSKHFSLKSVNLKASQAVALTVAWKWRINGADGEKFAYAMSLTGTQALSGVNTDYPFIEDVPPNTISWFEITTAGACEVALNMMGREK